MLRSRQRSSVTVALFFAWSQLFACSGGNEPQGGDAGADSGPTACGNDRSCPTGLKCNTATQQCEAAKTCPACAAPTPVCDQAMAACVGCATQGCPDGQTCDQTSGACQASAPDPCAGITCQPGLKCDPATRECVIECDVIAQNCAKPADKCTILDPGAVGCAPAGTVKAGQPCGGQGGDDCEKGAICAAAKGEASTCYTLCNADTCAGCAAGFSCAGFPDAAGKPVPGAGACIEVPPPCDVIKQDCGAGMKCSLLSNCGDTGCVPLTGNKTVGATCDPSTDDCGTGLICLSMGPACFAYCELGGSCPVGQQCSGFGPQIPFGHCMGSH